MNVQTQEYLERLTRMAPALGDCVARLAASWAPESPPLTILFSEVGDAIASHLAQMPRDLQQKLFAEIERGISSQNDELRTALTTGLIEALVGRSDKQPELVAELELLFGARSLKHAREWRDFGKKEPI